MKKIIIFLLLMGFGGMAHAQFPTTDSLRRFINRWIRNSAVEAFQNLRLNTALIGLTNFVDSANTGVDTIYRVPGKDSIFFRLHGTVYAIKDSTGGGGSGLTDGDKGDITVSSSGTVWTIDNNVVSNAKLRQSAGLSVIGTAANSTANVADITAGSDHQVLRRSGTTLGFGAVNLASSNAVTGILPGTNVGLTSTQIGYGNGSNVMTSEAAFTYNATTNLLYADSIDTKRVKNDFTLYNNRANFRQPLSILAFGNSIMVGLSASPIGDSSHPALVQKFVGSPLTNYAISGTGVLEATRLHYANINPGHTSMTFYEAGVNDGYFGGNTAKVRAKVYNGNKAVLVNHFLASYVTASSGSVTRVGAWNLNWPANTEGGKTAGAAYINASGSTMETSITGTNVVIGLMGQNSSGGTITVEIDAVAVETISTANQTDGLANGSSASGTYIPMVLVYSGLTNAAHTVKITYSSGSGLVLIDYFGTMTPASGLLYPALIVHAPKRDATGYASGGSLTDVGVDSINANISRAVAEFQAMGYPVYLSQVNSYLDPTYNTSSTSGLSSDHIHPNNTGHRQMFVSDIVALTNLPAVGRNGEVQYANGLYQVVDGVFQKIMTQNYADVNYIQNQLSNVQTGNFNISGKGIVGGMSTGVTMGFGVSANDNSVVIGQTSGGNTLLGLKRPLASAGNRIFQIQKGDGNVSFQFADSSGGAADIFTAFGSSSAVSELRCPPYLHLNKSSGTALGIDGYANGVGVDFGANGSVTGMYTPLNMSQSISGGIFLNFRNTSSNSLAEVNFKLTTAGSGSGSPSISLVNNNTSLNYSIGNDVGSGLLKITNGTTAAGTSLLHLSSTGELNLGNFTDQGSFTLQNTGGLYQNGLVNLRGVPAGVGSYSVLVHRHGSDSSVMQIPSTTFATPTSVSDSTGYFTVTGTTTNNTPTTLAAINMPSGQILHLEADVVAITSDGDYGYYAKKRAIFGKEAAGGLNSGADVDIVADSYVGSGGSPLSTATFEIDNDGATGAIIIVTGQTGRTIKWKVRYKIVSVNM